MGMAKVAAPPCAAMEDVQQATQAAAAGVMIAATHTMVAGPQARDTFRGQTLGSGSLAGGRGVKRREGTRLLTRASGAPPLLAPPPPPRGKPRVPLMMMGHSAG